jgi:hypothetical protein
MAGAEGLRGREAVPDMRVDYRVTLLCGCDVFLDGKLVMPAKPCAWLKQQGLLIREAEARGATDEVGALREGMREHYAERGFELYVRPPRD